MGVLRIPAILCSRSQLIILLQPVRVRRLGADYRGVGSRRKRHAFNLQMHDNLVPVSMSSDVLRIDGFETSERDIVFYFVGLPDLEDADKELERLLKLSILAQGSVGTMLDAKYVETAFDGLKERLTQNIDRIFDPNGEFSHLLEKHFGKDGTVREVLDPDKEDTPLNRLRTALHVELSEIKEAIAGRKGYLDAAKKGTQKGVEFEERCEPHVRSAAEANSDMVEATGSAAGDLGSSKKGDFVLTIGGTEKRIVFEMKHKAGMGLPEIRKELNGAMENRRAGYGVLVSRNRNDLPGEVGWFNEYDGNKLVCAVSETDEDDENMWVIKIAYRWARLRVASGEDKTLDVNPEVITRGVKEIGASLRRMGTVTAQCKSITASAEKIEAVMKDEEKKIRDRIDDIIHSMNRPNQ